MKNLVKIIVLLSLVLINTNCKKNKLKTTTVNGKVLNAVTQQPMSGIEVRLIEDAYGFPFSSSKIVETTTSDANGNFHFQRKTSKSLGVAISSNNEYISAAVTYPQIVTYKMDLELGKVNSVLLTPAEYGYVNASIIGDGAFDSILVKSDHVSFHSAYFVPYYKYNHGENLNFGASDRIIGKHYYEKRLFLNGVETLEIDTIEINKGQTTVFELHF